MNTHAVIHRETGVVCERFESAELAQEWIDNLRVNREYKERCYRVVTLTTVARERANAIRRAREQAMRDLGLKKVRGNLGGTYWE